MNKKTLFFSITLFLVILDQLTKFLIRTYKPELKITNFLSISYTTNTGIAFGLFKGYNIIFIIISLIFLGLIIYYYKTKKTYTAPFILITSGLIGNLIDRIFLGNVIDFINLSFWPAFNIADSCITIGAIILVIQLIKKK